MSPQSKQSTIHHEQSTNRLFIIGFMGSGKSFLGRQLAAYINWSFIDLDEEIEKSEGQSITEIFEQKGEEYFRNIETKVLVKTIEHKHTIIATGGGTPCFNRNMDWILKHGKSVYINVSPTILLGRLNDDRIKRPLLSNMNINNLSDYVKKTLEERKVFYNQANLVVEADITSTSLLQSIVELCQED